MCLECIFSLNCNDIIFALILFSSHIVFNSALKVFMPFTCALFCLPQPSTDLPLPTCGTKNDFSLCKKRRPVVQLHNSLKPWVVYCTQRRPVCVLSLWKLEAEHTSWWRTAGCQLLGTFWLGSVCSDLHPTQKVSHLLLPRGCALSPWVVQHHRLPLDHWQIGEIPFLAMHFKRIEYGVCFFRQRVFCPFKQLGL